ncbi:MAG: hypothetical protein U9Q22_02105, partial [Candidatus Altiarchaeota archaeon]|nr:hypothetical protein [Candidatus Altiarchaeota archaeon]
CYNTVKKMFLLPSDKDRMWYLDEMMHHVEEIRDLVERGDERYNEERTCSEHARIEAYDLVVLTAEAFGMKEVLGVVPDRIIERFNRKRR